MTDSAPAFGFNIIGLASANLGAGHSTREFVRALLDRGESVRILDQDAGQGRSKFDNTFRHLCVDAAEDLPYAVNIFIINALTMTDRALFPPKGMIVEGRLNAAFVWWELTDMPSHWYVAGRLYDVLITGSDFVRATLAAHVPGVPVLLAHQPIQIPDHVSPNRQRFGLPDGVFLAYMGFESYSDPVRKNPFGAIEAFKTAFADRNDCHLVIKVNNPDSEGKHQQLLEQMYDLVRDNQRIHLVKESLSYDLLLSLYASCDVFISLHRSEGLGLVPLEAMRLGKPVVATGWSGNMNYMDQRNACLVSFDFRPTDNTSCIYGPSSLGISGYWAEPDIAHAAAWLRKLADDPDFRAEIGQRAATDTARYQEQASRAEFVDELKAIWDNRSILPGKDRQALLRQANSAREKAILKKLGPLKYFTTKAMRSIKRELDRRFLWRFKK